MCPISDQITCLSHLLFNVFYWSSEGKNAQLFFELSPGLKYLFCSLGPTRHLRTPVWVGRCWYRPFHVLSWGSFLLINPKDRLALLEIDEMCSDFFNLLLTVIPRYDAESTCSSLDPQKNMTVEEVFAYLKCAQPRIRTPPPHLLSWATMTLKLIENFDSQRDFCEDRTMSC